MSARWLTLLASGAVAVLGGCKKEAPSAARPREETSHVASAPRLVRIPPELVATGRLRLEPVTVRGARGSLRLPAEVVTSAEAFAEAGSVVAGRLAKLEAQEGDHVKRGQALAWLDAPDAARAASEIVRARARVEAQTKKAERLEQLVASEAGTRLALDEARLELSLARADLSAARTVAAGIGIGEPAGGAAGVGSRLAVRSPVDGVVVERNASLGAYVSPPLALFRLVADTAPVVEAKLPEAMTTALGGSSAPVLLLREGGRCDASLLAVLPRVDASTRTRRVRLAPGPRCPRLSPGAQLEVEVETTTPGEAMDRTWPVVRLGALVDVRGSAFVFVATDDPGVFALRLVEPGPVLGESRAIPVGLVEGERVVVEGAVLLKGELLRAELGGAD